MSHTLDGVDNGTGKVVRWVSFVGVSGAMVGNVFSSVEDGITQTLNLVLHVELRPYAVVLVLTGEHTLKQCHVLLQCVISCLRLHSSVPLVLHFLGRQVVRVSFSLLNELLHVILEHLEVVGGVCHLIWRDVERLQIADDVVHKLYLLVHGIGVVKAQDHSAFVHLGIMEVHHSGFHMTNVKVTRRLGWETCYHCTLHCIDEHTLFPSVIVSRNLRSLSHLFTLSCLESIESIICL